MRPLCTALHLPSLHGGQALETGFSGPGVYQLTFFNFSFIPAEGFGTRASPMVSSLLTFCFVCDICLIFKNYTIMYDYILIAEVLSGIQIYGKWLLNPLTSLLLLPPFYSQR